jgi:hypothetical protein
MFVVAWALLVHFSTPGEVIAWCGATVAMVVAGVLASYGWVVVKIASSDELSAKDKLEEFHRLLSGWESLLTAFGRGVTERS